MTELFRIKLSDILANCQFWYATLVIYYQWRGIPTEQVFFLLSFYSICAFAFEYPTGVISDYFSPKLSLICGYLLSAVSVLLQTFPGNVYYYGCLLCLTAIGFTLTSGSDTSLIASVIGIFIISFKFFFNPFFEQLKLPLPIWGMLVSVSILFSALGIRIYKSYSELHLSNSVMLFIGAVFLMGITLFPVIAIIGFFLTYLIRGYIETQVDVLLNETITSRARASVLSFKSVFIRVGQSSYTFVGGFIVAHGSISPLIFLTTILLLLGCAYPLYRLRYLYGTQ
jgi:predicted MFS family arabinose efflux permease